MKVNPISTNGDLVDTGPQNLKEYWYVFYRIFRVLKKNENSYDLSTPYAARSIWAPDTIEGFWYRKLSDPFYSFDSAIKIPVKTRLSLYKFAGFSPLIKELRRNNMH